MSLLLFVDTETSGLFKKNLPLDSDQQPWVVSLAAELCDDVGRQIASINTGIRANGRKITEDARAVHGVSSALAGRTGVSELAALGVLCGRESLASQARYVIGHGVSFDRDVITSVLARNKRDATTWVRPGFSSSTRCWRRRRSANSPRTTKPADTNGRPWMRPASCC
jgi:hypothetical protein